MLFLGEFIIGKSISRKPVTPGGDAFVLDEYIEGSHLEGGFPLHPLAFGADLFIYPLYIPCIPLYSLSIAFTLTSLVLPELACET